MTTLQIIENISAIQSGYPVEKLTYQGHQIWPLIRNQLCYFLTTYTAEPRQNFDTVPDIMISKTVPWLWNALLRCVQGCNGIFVGSCFFLAAFITNLRGVNTLLIALPEHFTIKSETRSINPIVEGFVSILNKLAIRWTYSQYSYELARRPEFGNQTRLFDALNFMNRIFFSLSRRIFKKKHQAIEGFRDFANYCKDSRGFDPTHLESEIVAQHTPLARTYQQLFRIYRPKNLILYCYYDLPKMIAMMVAESNGIQTIELQHGRLKGHWAYESWGLSNMSANPYLPKAILVWDDSDREFLEEAQKMLDIQIKAIGNLWLGMNKSGSIIQNIDKSDFPALYVGEKKRVLHSLQGVGIDPVLLDVMKKSGKEIIWLVRVHPRNMEEKQEVISILDENNINYEIEKSSSYPLYEILRNVEFHTTDCSVICREAEMFKVKNILYTKLGYESFRSSILAGDYYYATKPDQILSYLLDDRHHKTGVKARKNSNRNPSEIIRTMLLSP